jgi:murein hydrolase activator
MLTSRFIALSSLWLAAASLEAVPVAAQDSSGDTSSPSLSPDLGRAQDNLNAAESDLQTSAERQARLQIEVANALKAQEQLSAELVEAAAAIASLQDALVATEARVSDLDAEALNIKADLASKQDMLSELLAGLQRLEQNPPPALVVSPEDILTALRGAMMFGAVVPEMSAETSLLLNQLERLGSIRRETESERITAGNQLTMLVKSQDDIAGLITDKQQLASLSGEQLETERKASQALVKKAQNLKQLVAALEQQETERRARMTAEAKAREEEFARQQAALARPPMVFSQARGRLDYPVQGEIIGRFGADSGLGGPLNGIAIATRQGLQVRSPVDGKVEFAGPFRSYGQLLIVNVGERFLVLLSGMNETSVTAGQSLRAGEPIGTMGDKSSSAAIIFAESTQNRPILYIEFRQNGEPVDPDPWWIGSRREARQ